MTEPSEGELLIRHRNGDPQAFADLVSHYRAPVYSYLVRTGIAPADRDDLFQEIFLRIHRSADQFRADRPLHPWVFTIVANTVRNHHRRQRVRQLVHGEAPEDEIAVDGSDSERTAAARQTMAWLVTQLTTLPEVRRQVLLLATVEGLSLPEIAKALSLPLGTVKTHLRRTRLELARRLAAHQQETHDVT